MFFIQDFHKALLRHTNDGALTVTDQEGRVRILVRNPGRDGRLLSGPLPILHSLFMFPMPTAPLICWVIELIDTPQDPLRVDAYLDILNADHAARLECLARQGVVPLHLICAQDPCRVVTKWITPPSNVIQVSREAARYARCISPDRYNFDAAKAAFKAMGPLSDPQRWWY